MQAVVIDMAMPVMGGRGLVEQLSRSHPETPVLLISGYSADELARQGLLPNRSAPLLPKPFAPETLVERVRALIGSGRSVAK